MIVNIVIVLNHKPRALAAQQIDNDACVSRDRGQIIFLSIAFAKSF